ncbi:MAG: type II toxin-antitoxin system VapC family toxin [Gemmatimonadetes bacterium]|nr:type II toxin-antitoxin system VapC family toxin [Gemmatimonadota bacterium]
MQFWDSSALVARLVGEPGAVALQHLPTPSPLVVWWGTRLECESALARLERTLSSSRVLVDAYRQQLGVLANHWHEVQPSPAIRARAVELVRRWPLRAADALQLSAALEVAEPDPARLHFVTLDVRLADAARGEQLSVGP